MRKKLLYLFLITSFVHATAQSNNVSDLKKQLLTITSDTAKIDAYDQLSISFVSINVDSSIYYYEKSFELAKNIKDYKRIAATQRSIIPRLMNKGKYVEVKRYLDQGLELGYQLDDDIIIAHTLISIANWNWKLSNLKKAIEHLNEALIYSKKTKNLKLKSRIFNSFSLIYSEMEEYEKAYAFKIQHYEISKQRNDTMAQAIALNNLGHSHIRKKQYSKALLYLEQSIPLVKAVIKRKPIIYELVLSNKCMSLIELGQKDLGFSILESGLELAIQNKHPRTIAIFNKIKSNALFSYKEYDEAIESAKIGVANCKKTKFIKHLPTLCSILAKSYKAKNDYQSSLEWLEEEKKFLQDLAERRQKKEIIQLEINHELQQKETENQILLLKNKNKNTFIALLFATFLIISFLIFYLLRKKQEKQFEILRQKVAADLHDDVGGNLNSISRIAKGLKLSNNHEELIEGIDLLVSKSNTAIKNVVDVVWALDTEENKIEYLIEKMEDILYGIKHFNKSVNIIFNKENINKEKSISIDLRHNLLMIFKEAINNIQKHTSPKSINVTLKNPSQQFQLQIVNSFTERKTSPVSNGHGIINIKRRVKEMNGTVNINETEHSFSLTISLSK